MGFSKSDDSQPLPGVIATLTAGFELTTGHVWLIGLPILLDVFYWLGPRLSVRELVERNIALMLAEPELAQLSTVMEQLAEVAGKVNLFTSLRLPIIGVPALMSEGMPAKTPVEPVVIEVSNTLVWITLFATLSLIGLLLTTVYMSAIAQVIGRQSGGAAGLGSLLRPVFSNFGRLFGLIVLFLVVVAAISMLLFPVAFVLALVDSSLFIAVIFMGFVIVATYMSLAIPGVLLKGRPVFKSVVESVRLVHQNLMPTVTLFLFAFVISRGMALLWLLADDGSWLTLISIAGHGFINTALAMAVFLFYQSRYGTLKQRS